MKSRISVFSPGESKVGINTWGLCTAIDGPESFCWCVLKAVFRSGAKVCKRY